MQPVSYCEHTNQALENTITGEKIVADLFN